MEHLSSQQFEAMKRFSELMERHGIEPWQVDAHMYEAHGKDSKRTLGVYIHDQALVPKIGQILQDMGDNQWIIAPYGDKNHVSFNQDGNAQELFEKLDAALAKAPQKATHASRITQSGGGGRSTS